MQVSDPPRREAPWAREPPVQGDRGGWWGGKPVNPAAVLAFGSGLAAAFNPCAIAMLPATIGLLLGRWGTGPATGGLRRLAQGLLTGAMLWAGFSVVVVAAALGFHLFTHAVFGALRPLMWALAVLLLAVGVLMFLDRPIAGPRVGSMAERVRGIGGGSVVTLAAAGAAYGLASLSCTLPLFVALMAETTGGALVLTVTAFVAGVAVVLLAVAVGTTLWKSAMERVIRAALPYVMRVSGVIVVLAGLWLGYYWSLGPGRFGI